VLCYAVLSLLTHLGCAVRARSEQVGVACGPLHVVYHTVMGVRLKRREDEVEGKGEKMSRDKKRRC
jgi:hypothetical protein